ncbi:DUF2071 domain-containing protein [Paenibacillus sp. TRM 82003]|nr:DUF2071 domain-containing protein [Paenibacillus sp. TRM 82003]
MLRLRPNGTWIMRQGWKNVLFMHWPVPTEAMQARVPNRLTIDTFEEQAWISLVLFVIDGVWLRGWPFPILPAFPEINIRTYVTHQGKPGIYFLSLDAPHWATYTAAKRWYRLPYARASINLRRDEERFVCRSERYARADERRAVFEGEFIPSESRETFARPGTLEHWATERYRLYSADAAGRLYSAEVQHPPWPLQGAEAEIRANTMIASLGIHTLGSAPVLRYSAGVNALIANIGRHK